MLSSLRLALATKDSSAQHVTPTELLDGTRLLRLLGTMFAWLTRLSICFLSIIFSCSLTLALIIWQTSCAGEDGHSGGVLRICDDPLSHGPIGEHQELICNTGVILLPSRRLFLPLVGAALFTLTSVSTLLPSSR
jgi:hypothetical protein